VVRRPKRHPALLPPTVTRAPNDKARPEGVTTLRDCRVMNDVRELRHFSTKNRDKPRDVTVSAAVRGRVLTRD